MIQEFSGIKHFMDQKKVYHARMDGETSLKRKDALSLEVLDTFRAEISPQIVFFLFLTLNSLPCRF